MIRLGTWLRPSSTARLKDSCQSGEDDDCLVQLVSGQVHLGHLLLSDLDDDPSPFREFASLRPRAYVEFMIRLSPRHLVCPVRRLVLSVTVPGGVGAGGSLSKEITS